MKATVGMKVTAYTGRCIGILIESTTWQGEVVKVNKKSIRVRLTESVSKFGSKEKGRWTMNHEVAYTFSKVLSTGEELFTSEGNIYGKIVIK